MLTLQGNTQHMYQVVDEQQLEGKCVLHTSSTAAQ
jgi:hypothetical protein